MKAQPGRKTRRRFMKESALYTLGANISVPWKRTDKPNLLFLWTDEQRADTMEVYGNSRIRVPHLNKLASESVVFRKAYCSQPVCTPSRSTIMTGFWPHQTGCVTNNIPLEPDTRTFPEILNDPDYRTGYMGKWHLGDEIFPQHGFEEWEAIEDGYRRFYSHSRDRDASSSYAEFLKSLGYEPNTDEGFFSRSFCSNLPFEHCKPEFLRRKACDFLHRHRNEPFILHVNYLEPHMPFHGPLDGAHSPEEVSLPGNFEDPLEENEPVRYRVLRQGFYEHGFRQFQLQTEQHWRRLIANYWGLVTQVDRSIGAIIETLERLGLSANTIVVHTSDHGDMMGSHRLLAKTVSYEESVRVPWLIRYPGKVSRRLVVEEPVSHIDLVPTLLEMMNRPAEPGAFPGKSLVPRIAGNKQPAEPVFVQWTKLNKKPPQVVLPGIAPDTVRNAFDAPFRMVVSPEGWKLCLYDGDNNQLFNLREDPGETTNLYGLGRYGEITARLRRSIRTWQESVDDAVEV